MRAVVTADSETWTKFRTALAGNQVPPQFGRRILSELYGFRQAALERKKNAWAVRTLRDAGVPLIEVADANQSKVLSHLVSAYNPEYFVSVAFPQIFRDSFLSACERSPVNFHPSILPRCRGAHPHFWAIASGEKIGGVSSHFLTSGIDEGNIVAQISFPISGMYYSEYCSRVFELSDEIVLKTQIALRDRKFVGMSQDIAVATTFRNDREIHRRIFWDIMNEERVLNLIRTEAAFCFLNGRRVRPIRGNVERTNRNATNEVKPPPGTIIDITPLHVVVCGPEGFVSISKFRWLGKSVSAAAWVAMSGAQIGCRFL